MLHLFFEENRLWPGFCEIFLNMEDSTSAHLTFKKRSWLCENKNCLGVVKMICGGTVYPSTGKYTLPSS